MLDWRRVWAPLLVALALAALALGVLWHIGNNPSLALGSFARMGPGYWPALLACALLLVAAWLLWRDRPGAAATAARAADAAPACGTEVPADGHLQAALLTLLAVLAFALLAPKVGVAGATWLLALVAAWAADPRWLQALAVGSALTLACLALFVYGLQVPFRLLPP